MSAKNMNPSLKILIGLIVGILIGLVFQDKAAYIEPIGAIYLKLIKMLVMPLILCSIASAVAGIKDAERLRRIGGKTVGLYIVNSAVTACLGIFIAQMMRMGEGLDLSGAVDVAAVKAPSIMDVFDSMVTDNIFAALTNFESVPVIIFAAFFGYAIIKSGEKGKLAGNVIESTVSVIYTVFGLIMKAAPVGVCCLIAPVIGVYGKEAASELGKWVVAGYTANLIIILGYTVAGMLFGKIPFKKFISAASKVYLQAFTTRSSAATLPINIEVTTEELGVPEEIAGFALPLGATINMSGTSVAMGIFVVMSANAFGISLGFTDILVTVFLAVVSGIGMSSVPNQGLIFMTMICGFFGMPLTVAGMITGVDVLCEMPATASNTVGDLVATVMVARSEHAIDDDYEKRK